MNNFKNFSEKNMTYSETILKRSYFSSCAILESLTWCDPCMINNLKYSYFK